MQSYIEQFLETKTLEIRFWDPQGAAKEKGLVRRKSNLCS